jgi:phosphate transport system protein
MAKIFERELKHLEQQMTALSARVEENVLLAVKAVKMRDLALATRIIEDDVTVDAEEVQLEEECLKILALHQPVAGDLRLVVSILKINNDLERVGDYAVSIADSARDLCELPQTTIPDQLSMLADTALDMLKEALDSFVRLNGAGARHVCQLDPIVDNAHRSVYEYVKATVTADPSTLETGLHLLRISHALERVGDHATNIAEDVIYIAEGGIVRHRNV